MYIHPDNSTHRSNVFRYCKSALLNSINYIRPQSLAIKSKRLLLCCTPLVSISSLVYTISNEPLPPVADMGHITILITIESPLPFLAPTFNEKLNCIDSVSLVSFKRDWMQIKAIVCRCASNWFPFPSTFQFQSLLNRRSFNAVSMTIGIQRTGQAKSIKWDRRERTL